MADKPADASRWRLRDVCWGEVLRRQDLANILLTVFIMVAAAVVNFMATPHKRVYFIYDASISYPATEGFKDSWPAWAAGVIPWLMMIATVVVGEMVYSRREHKSATDAVAATMYFCLDGMQSFACGILLALVFKLTAGRLRPNFLERCQPDVPAGTDWTTLQWGQDNPQAAYPCTGDSAVVEEGRKSFPSGHTSSAFNFTVYASAYLIWCFNMRFPRQPCRLSVWQEFKADLSNVAAKIWMLAMLSVAWGIGISRTLDNQHNYSDILGGMMLGTMIALVYAARAIPRYRRVLSPESSECMAAQQEQQQVGDERIDLEASDVALASSRDGLPDSA